MDGWMEKAYRQHEAIKTTTMDRMTCWKIELWDSLWIFIESCSNRWSSTLCWLVEAHFQIKEAIEHPSARKASFTDSQTLANWGHVTQNNISKAILAWWVVRASMDYNRPVLYHWLAPPPMSRSATFVIRLGKAVRGSLSTKGITMVRDVIGCSRASKWNKSAAETLSPACLC